MNRNNPFVKMSLPALLGVFTLVIALLITAKTPAAAQTAATETPLQALPTFTPTLDPNAATAAALPAGTEALSGIPTISGTPGDTVMAAYQKAKAVLFKSLNVPLGPVVSYTYTIVAFTDSGLNCALGGTPVKSGFNGGYSFVFTLYKYQNGGGQYEVHTNVDASNIVICQTVGGSTLAGTAAVGLGAPVAGHITGGFEIGGQVQSFSLGTAGHMNQAKMKWVKFQFAPGDGGAASAISAAHTQGFKALISLKGAASDISGGAAYFASYAANAATVAQSGADAIEVWNEENLDREWPNGQIDPVLYTQLLSKAFNAIYSANPSTMVILGAPSPTGAAGPGGKTAAYWNDDTYYAGLAAAGAGNYADCIGIHYNEGVVSPTQASGDPRDNYPTRYFSTMLARASGAFPGKQVCFTELGFLTPEGYSALPAGFTWAQNTTVAEQAQWLAQAAVSASSSGIVRLMIVFNVDFSYYGADPQAGYAIIRAGGLCPACDSRPAAVAH